MVVGLLLLSSIPVGGEASTDEEIREFYQDSDKRSVVVIGLYLSGLAAVSFIVFLAGSHRPGPLAEDELTGTIRLGALLTGSAFVASLAIGAALLAAVAGAIALGGEPDDLSDTGVVRFIAQAGYAAFLAMGGLFAGFFAIMHSMVTLRTGRFAKWVGWVGVVVGVLVAAVSIAFIPFLLFPLWVLLVGTMMWTRSGDPADSPVVESPAV